MTATTLDTRVLEPEMVYIAFAMPCVAIRRCSGCCGATVLCNESGRDDVGRQSARKPSQPDSAWSWRLG